MSFASVTCDASIPVIKYRPDLSEVASCENIVVFDLETSSLGLDCDILQITASHLHKTSEYSTYIQPSKSISTQASAVTCLTSKGGVLFYKGDPVQVLSQEAAFQNFTSWLEQHKPCVLAAHNCKTFDARRLLYSLSKFTCFGEFRQNVSGFVDTLPLFKTFYPDLPNHKQNTIFKDVCKSDYIAHNAIEDVEALRVLLGNISIDYKKFSFTIESMNSQMKFDNVSKVDQETFTTLITQKIIKQRTADVMAKSGLKLNHLYYAFEKEGEDGIRELLLEKRRDGSHRVTKNKSIITKLIDYFKRQ
ncbi:DNA polymerase III PolC-type-like [Mytilus trossulus]|uniref:DNA polymerase III PolC-type-like n=1 Tax=Mytilus trossulus TaxID=6551 RepID=UPI0030065946